MSTKLKAHQKALIAMVVFVTAALLLAAGVWAYDTAQKDQIAPGVTVGGVDVGGRSAEDARDVIEDEVVAPLSKPVVVNFDGEPYRLTPKRAETSADLDGMVDEAVERDRDGGLVERVSRYVQGSRSTSTSTPGSATPRRRSTSSSARSRRRSTRTPLDASIEPSTTELVPTPGQPGVALRENQMRKLITRQVESPGAGKRIEAEVQAARARDHHQGARRAPTRPTSPSTRASTRCACSRT